MRDEAKKMNVMIFASEQVGLASDQARIDIPQVSANFERLDSPRRFEEFDGVVVFQRTFERFDKKIGPVHSYMQHTVLRDELDHRNKEATLLLQKGGFICFVLHAELIDHYERQMFGNQDLVKRFLSADAIDRRDLLSRLVNIDSEIQEFTPFLSRFGSANSTFTYHLQNSPIRPLAKVGGRIAGLISKEQIFFVPAMLPSWGPAVATEFFELILKAVTSTFCRLRVGLPQWTRGVKFVEELTLDQEQERLERELAAINGRRSELDRMKRILVAEGSLLVEDVAAIFREVFGFRVDSKDDYREDMRLLDTNNSPVVFVEVKGVTRGVKREHINQADSHRERASLPDEFPTLLIVNTAKAANSLAEKEQRIDAEQVRHAVKLRVLVLRTLDLLYLTRMVLAQTVTRDQARDILMSHAGWLKADASEWSIELQEHVPRNQLIRNSRTATE